MAAAGSHPNVACRHLGLLDPEALLRLSLLSTLTATCSHSKEFRDNFNEHFQIQQQWSQDPPAALSAEMEVPHSHLCLKTWDKTGVSSSDQSPKQATRRLVFTSLGCFSTCSPYRACPLPCYLEATLNLPCFFILL